MEGEKKTNETHILVIPFPLQGHINPMVQFAKRLASKGLRVTLIATTSIGKTMQTPTSSVKIESISDGFEEGEKIEGTDIHLERFRVGVSQSLVELIEKQKGYAHPPKVLVYDAFMPWALDVAQRLGLHGAAFFTQSCAVCAVYYHVHQGALKIPIQDPTTSLPSMPLLGIDDMPSFVCDTASYPSLLNLVLIQFSNFQKAN
ncbi:hypothetical protein L1049_016794 [Liquidambar formosana]|uniref:Glycosyltransferase N-terminal domain-containing protein n=1 Tax=Liquidambar formosana TaxID=63359 RepID=A0AAP0X3B4_LIQFO